MDLGGRGVCKNISAELEGAVIFSKNAENLILCQEVLARIAVSRSPISESMPLTLQNCLRPER